MKRAIVLCSLVGFAVVCMSILTACPVAAQDNKARVTELQKEIASLKAKLSKLEKELASLTDGPEIGPVKKIDGQVFRSFKVGDIGRVGNHAYSVREIINNEQAIIEIDGFAFATSSASTKGLAPGTSVQIKGVWRVVSPVGWKRILYPAITNEKNGELVVR